MIFLDNYFLFIFELNTGFQRFQMRVFYLIHLNKHIINQFTIMLLFIHHVSLFFINCLLTLNMFIDNVLSGKWIRV